MKARVAIATRVRRRAGPASAPLPRPTVGDREPAVLADFHAVGAAHLIEFPSPLPGERRTSLRSPNVDMGEQAMHPNSVRMALELPTDFKNLPGQLFGEKLSRLNHL